MSNPTTPQAAPKPKLPSVADLAGQLKSVLEKPLTDDRINTIVLAADKEDRFNAEQLRAACGQALYWLKVLNGEEAT